MTVYVIVYFITMLYYMVTCATAGDTFGCTVVRGMIASVTAAFWPATITVWIIRDARAMYSGRKG